MPSLIEFGLLGIGAFIIFNKVTGLGGQLAKEAGTSVGGAAGDFLGTAVGATGAAINSAFTEAAPELSAGIDTILDMTVGPKAPELVGVNADVLVRQRFEVESALFRWENEEELYEGDTFNGQPVFESDSDFITRLAKRCVGDGDEAKKLGWHDLCPRILKAEAEIQEWFASVQAFFQPEPVNDSESFSLVFSANTDAPTPNIFNMAP